MRMAGEKLMEDVAAEIKSVDFYKFDPDINILKSNLDDIGFGDNLTSITSGGYPSNSDVAQNCPIGYEAKLYKVKDVLKSNIDNSTTHIYNYKYTIKLCVDVDYLNPYLKRAILTCFWDFRNKSHKVTTEVFIAPKG
jgi:hypothetical protein